MHPVKTQTSLRVEGRIDQRISAKEAEIGATLYDPQNKPCAQSKGRFALFESRTMRRMGIIDAKTIADYEKYFAKR